MSLAQAEKVNLLHSHSTLGVRGPTDPHESSQMEAVATQLVHYVDELLSRRGYRLNSQTATALAQVVGEVIDNAERHSGREHWWVGARASRQKKNASELFEFVIFDFGETISGTLQALSADSTTRREIEQLISMHHHRIDGQQLTEENLWTLYALQEGVSSKSGPGPQGLGMSTLIRFFQILATGSEPGYSRRGPRPGIPPQMRMGILSGQTNILFDGRYHMTNVYARGGQHRAVIAFNSTNSLREPPDPKCVHPIRTSFPGTCVSVRVPILGSSLSNLRVDSVQ